ncbi:prolyl oligopeptidase family serine peptidase [Pseudoxanthomonas yeongjuensis]|uniref:prolyl oligopeptidase family serine peptidase n=1 Tax=Pseudoxanthomonas yeongjuensis TaxID=377616 RepID=UPI0013910456|nr:prolyl oligopeptidase family serine peptidase [Pseudoxanthomonas yeongjuensis]
MHRRTSFSRPGPIRIRFITGMRALLTLIAALPGTTLAAQAASAFAEPGRVWTLQDIAAAPEIVDLSVSEDGRQAMYIIRHGDLDKNAKISSLHRVDLATGVDRELKSSTWLSKLQIIPGSTDWSVLADTGDGVQLYRVDGTGRFKAMLINRDLDQVGGAAEGRQAFGISDYGWSPDGKSCWYEKRTSQSPDTPTVNPLFLPLITTYGANPVELWVRSGDGEDALLDRIDAIAGGYFTVEWDDTSSSLTYWVRSQDRKSLEQRRWSRHGRKAEALSSESSFHVPVHDARGPRGGSLATTGFGGDRKLIETLKDGSVVEYGRAGFRLGDPRASGTWISPAGDVALLGTRYYDDTRYGLVRVMKSGAVEEVPVAGSLTNCSVNRAFTAGVCVRQSMISPPELVRLDPRKGGATSIVGLAPSYATIRPLRVAPRTWTNRNGYKANGYLVYPRDYEKGRKYPAILVTHGSDADQRFVDAGFQWDYPVQVWAERGYVVIAMNESAVSDSAELGAAYAQWGGAPGPLPMERVQDLIWINTVSSFEDAVKDLDKEGLVDASRVGIAGYSAGSQMVNVAMTRSKAFRAASSGDGGYLEPSGYFSNSASYRPVFGGSPYDPAAVPLYRRLSPTFRAAQAAGPVLQQVASGHASQLGFHVSLRDAGVPSELVYYPNESHLFHQPRNRLTAMQENIEWFDYWLLGKEDPDPAKIAQYERWREMREKWENGAKKAQVSK